MNTASNLDAFACPLDGAALIEASAGTGKTWNIAALYLRLVIERGLGVEKILVVTFTNAATAELRTRLRARLQESLFALQHPAAADAHAQKLFDAAKCAGITDRQVIERRLQAALANFDAAAVHTIHAFCQRALAEVPFAAGLPFALELLPDDLEMRLRATADFWRREVAAAPLSRTLAAELAKADSPLSWAELLRRRVAKPLARVEWPAPQTGEDADGLATKLEAAYSRARKIWQKASPAVPDVLLAGLSQLNGTTYKAAAVETAAAAWAEYFSQDAVAMPQGDDAKKMPLFGIAQLSERTKQKCVTPSHEFFSAAQSVLDLHAELAQALIGARLDLLRRMLDAGLEDLAQAKRQSRIAAYDDLLGNLHHALASGRCPWLAARLAERYSVALIDEFQDTDPLQFAIFDRIFGAHGGRPGNLFLVGDPKQAIYSFRNADLHTYLGAKQQVATSYTLGENQRAVPGLIAACNKLFATNPAAFILPGLDFQPVREGARPRPQLVDISAGSRADLVVWRLPQADGQAMLRSSAMAGAINATAAEIARLLAAAQAGQIHIDGRPLAAGDIAVLVVSHAQAAKIKRALAALAIGSVELSQASVFASAEAEELERVLAAMLQPGRRPLLLAALSTQCMGADAAALAALAENETGLSALVAKWETYREHWLQYGPGMALRRWMLEQDVAARLLALPEGERRMTNLLHLMELLHQEASVQTTPDAQLAWLAAQRAAPQAGDAAQLRLESDRNLVQIVTVHKSKGLEYAFTFCPFLWDGYDRQPAHGDAIEYHAAGGGLVMDFRPQSRDDTSIKDARRRERHAEKVRLMYVALTRAVLRCYLVIGVYDKPSFGRPSLTESTHSLLNWLVAGANTTHETWLQNKLSGDAIDAAWKAYAENLPGVELLDLPGRPGTALAAGADASAHLQLAALPAVPGPGWRMASFSSLQHGAGTEAAADHDTHVTPAPRAALPPELPPDDVLRFPRGPAAGDCMHAAFEAIDFTQPQGWDTAIAAALARHPQPQREREQAAQHSQMLRRMLGDVCATPLADGLALQQIARSERCVEMGFHLPARPASLAALPQWAARHGYALPRLGTAELQGYLKGYMDLVFRHDGRYYLLDWKSNHLGHAAENYAAPALTAAMNEHGYHLQYLIYCVALLRHLARRLPDFNVERDFGGVFYLFVRGVRPHWKDGAGRPLGVYAHRPDAQALASLDQLLTGDGA
ncbi:MAG: exodeoxyribonuclease V subunit beta [Rhodocyclaceae bacterium]|nr:exodeoxyribonuclease V subunit beta [Rhodocyclaceae bacterium]